VIDCGTDVSIMQGPPRPSADRSAAQAVGPWVHLVVQGPDRRLLTAVCPIDRRGRVPPFRNHRAGFDVCYSTVSSCRKCDVVP